MRRTRRLMELAKNMDVVQLAGSRPVRGYVIFKATPDDLLAEISAAEDAIRALVREALGQRQPGRDAFKMARAVLPPQDPVFLGTAYHTRKDGSSLIDPPDA